MLQTAQASTISNPLSTEYTTTMTPLLTIYENNTQIQRECKIVKGHGGGGEEEDDDGEGEMT